VNPGFQIQPDPIHIHPLDEVRFSKPDATRTRPVL